MNDPSIGQKLSLTVRENAMEDLSSEDAGGASVVDRFKTVKNYDEVPVEDITNELFTKILGILQRKYLQGEPDESLQDVA